MIRQIGYAICGATCAGYVGGNALPIYQYLPENIPIPRPPIVQEECNPICGDRRIIIVESLTRQGNQNIVFFRYAEQIQNQPIQPIQHRPTNPYQTERPPQYGNQGQSGIVPSPNDFANLDKALRESYRVEVTVKDGRVTEVTPLLIETF